MILELSSDQQSFKEHIEQFVRGVVAPQAADIDDAGRLPADLVAAAAAEGLMGVTVPKAWGGAGRDYLSYTLAIEAIARGSGSLAAALSVTNSLAADLIAHAGREPQKERWLRRLAGGALGAFALSDPGAGTDLANQQTTAVKGGGGYRIAGRKVWVANADSAVVAIVFAATRPGQRERGITAFLVPMDAAGISRTPRTDALGMRGLGCADLDLDVTVGEDDVLGQVDQGFDLAMWAVTGARVAVAAQAIGLGEAAIAEALAHARQREQFGQPIASYQAIQFGIADAATELAAARLLTWKAAAARGESQGTAFEASMAKLAASEASRMAIDKAMQILASAGYRRGSAVDRLFRDIRATEIDQGTAEAQRLVMAAHILA